MRERLKVGMGRCGREEEKEREGRKKTASRRQGLEWVMGHASLEG